MKVDGPEYGALVRQWFSNHCPYCLRSLAGVIAVVEHLDGMNRYRTGLHVTGNVLVACKRCNGEKRRDDSVRNLSLAESGWASFLSHDGTRCTPRCMTCEYWRLVWADEGERGLRMSQSLDRIRVFRASFPEFEQVMPGIRNALPPLLTKLYLDCQTFAETETKALLEKFEEASPGAPVPAHETVDRSGPGRAPEPPT